MSNVMLKEKLQWGVNGTPREDVNIAALPFYKKKSNGRY